MSRRALSSLPVRDLWAVIDEWLAKEQPSLVPLLAPPLSDGDISELEARLGTELPADYRASLRVHAGGRTKQGRSRIYAESPFYDFRLLSPEVLVQERTFLEHYAALPVSAQAQIAPTVRRAYYDRAWIPVAQADEDRAVFHCIDTAPARADGRFQIVEMVTNDLERVARWADFRTMLDECVVAKIVAGAAIDEDCFAETGTIRFLPS